MKGKSPPKENPTGEKLDNQTAYDLIELCLFLTLSIHLFMNIAKHTDIQI